MENSIVIAAGNSQIAPKNVALLRLPAETTTETTTTLDLLAISEEKKLEEASITKQRYVIYSPCDYTMSTPCPRMPLALPSDSTRIMLRSCFA